MKKNFFREDVAVKEDRFNVIRDLSLPSKRIDAAKLRVAIYLVIANLNFYKDSILIEHFSNRYKVSPHRSFKTERKVIERLHALGYVEYYRALSNVEFKKLKDSGHDMSEHIENGKHRLSEMWLTDKGKSFFSGVKTGVQLVTRRTRMKQLEDGKSKVYYCHPFREDEFEVLQKYEALLTNLNGMMRKYKLQYVDAETVKIVEFNNDCRIIFTGNESNKIYKHTRRGGRFVSKVAYLWKKHRQSTTIDGKGTVEIDYMCSLVSIMFGMFKVDLSTLEHDLYYVPGEENCPYMRLLAKTIVVCMLGVANEYTLELALSNKFYRYQNGLKEDGYPVERFFPENFEFEDIKRVIGKILHRYRQLCPRVDKILFKKDLATNILQGIEARIATRIMIYFVQIGKPILCIHDSFRVLEEDEDLLYKLMKESYFAEVGMNPLGLKVDRQPFQCLQVNESSSFDFKVATEVDYSVDAVEIYYDDCVEFTDTADTVEDIQYVFDGILHKFDNTTNQDYAWDSAFKE